MARPGKGPGHKTSCQRRGRDYQVTIIVHRSAARFSPSELPSDFELWTVTVLPYENAGASASCPDMQFKTEQIAQKSGRQSLNSPLPASRLTPVQRRVRCDTAVIPQLRSRTNIGYSLSLLVDTSLVEGMPALTLKRHCSKVTRVRCRPLGHRVS